MSRLANRNREEIEINFELSTLIRPRIDWQTHRAVCNLSRTNLNMKSSYELAMERLAKTSPTVKVTAAQKTELAELESLYAAKIAERDIFLKSELAKAVEKQDLPAYQQIEKQMVSDRKSFQAELEEKKDIVRQQNV